LLNNTQLPTFTLNAPSGLFQTPVTFTSGTGTLLLSNTNTAGTLLEWTGTNTVGPVAIGPGLAITGGTISATGGGGGTVGPYTALSTGTSITITCNASTSGTNNTLAISGTQNQLVFSGTASGDFGSVIVTSTGVGTLQFPAGANLSTLTLTGTAYLGWQITTGSNSLWVQNLNATLVSGALTSGSATVVNALLSTWPHPIVVDIGSSITNLGSLQVSVSGSTATIRSSNILDTSSFDLHIIPNL
jgi:hypothetical protein